jgi:hypothetical protein
MEYQHGLYLDGKLWEYAMPNFDVCTAPKLLPLTDSDIAQLKIALETACRNSFNADSDIFVDILRTTATRYHDAISFGVSMNDTDELIYVRSINGYVPRYKYLYTSARKRTIA